MSIETPRAIEQPRVNPYDYLRELNRQPQTLEGVKMYTRKIPGKTLLGLQFHTTEAKKIFQDNVYYRGMVLGDLILAAVEGGEIITPDDYDRTLTRVTGNLGHALSYAEQHIKDPTIMNRLAKKLQVTPDQVDKHLLMSPIITRFQSARLSQRVRIYGHPRQSMYNVTPPATIDDLTPEFVTHLQHVTGIDLYALRQNAQQKTQK